MEIIFKIIICLILINVIYKYIIDNNMLIILTSLAMYSFINLSINFVELSYILVTIILLTIAIETLKKKSKTIYQMLNLNQTEIIRNGIVNYKNLNKINMSLDDLLKKLEYENIDEIELCLIDKNKDITLYRNKDKIPTTLIIEGKIKHKNLITIKKNEEWLQKMLFKRELDIDDIFYAFYVENKIYFIKN